MAKTIVLLFFLTVAQGTDGRLHPSRERVAIQNQGEYQSWFGGTPPISPAVDFSKEDVIAVSMGNRPTGGYSVDVRRVEVRRTGSTAGFGFVHVVEHHPLPSTTPPPGPTQPFDVVKIPKGPLLYQFLDDTPAAGFDKLTLALHNIGTNNTTTIALDAGGHVVLRTSGSQRRPAIVGTATSFELKAIDDALIAAKVFTLPRTIRDTRNPPGETEFNVGGTIGGGINPYRETATIAKDGKTTVRRFTGPSGGTVYTGQATRRELEAVKDAFANARVKSLPRFPAAIVDPAPINVLPDESLVSRLGGRTYTTVVQKAGLYGIFTSRVKPLVDAVRALADHVVAKTRGRSITGPVALSGGVLKVGSYRVPGSDPFYGLLSVAKGKTVKLEVRIDRRFAHVLDVDATIAAIAAPQRAFPSPLGTIVQSLGAGTRVVVNDFSLPLTRSGAFYEVAAHGRLGYVKASSIAIGR